MSGSYLIPPAEPLADRPDPIEHVSHGEDGVTRAALISRDGRYRYRLERRWGEGEPVNLVMLNPSTADELIDDATIRRCVGFAKSWDFQALVVTNLFAFRATDPRDLLDCLKASGDPVGPANDRHILDAATESACVVAAWGGYGVRHRADAVLKMLRSYGIKVHYLKANKDLTPAHPLYLPGHLVPVEMEATHAVG